MALNPLKHSYTDAERFQPLRFQHDGDFSLTATKYEVKGKKKMLVLSVADAQFYSVNKDLPLCAS